VGNGEEAYGITAKAVSRRAKIRSALCSWNPSPTCIGSTGSSLDLKYFSSCFRVT
jgi:hypothetical protein